MNGNFLSMMAQRFPQMQQQNPQLLQMLMARRQQASILPVGQPIRQPTSPNINPPLTGGDNMLVRGPVSGY